MKEKAIELDTAAREGGDTSTASKEETTEEVPEQDDDDQHGPKYKAIMAALQLLKPTHVKLIDNSHQHAGHAGNDIDGESHFELQIVAEAFDGLNLVERHKLIYMILGDLMPQIHALQIRSLTPEEAARS